MGEEKNEEEGVQKRQHPSFRIVLGCEQIHSFSGR